MKSKDEEVLCALVTGGGRGLGHTISRRLGRDRLVMIVGRTESFLVETCALIVADGGRAEYVVGDLTEDETVVALGSRLGELGWSVDALVLNAGIGKSGPSDEFPGGLFRDIFALNVFSAMSLVSLVAPGMKARCGGSICFIGSTASLKGVSHDAAYTASKHAQVGLARTLAIEFGKYGISVVPVCPGFVESDMTTRTIHGVAQRREISLEEARVIVEKKNPQRRIIPAEEVAEVVAFVCSGRVPSLSGSPIVMSCGGSF